MGRSVSTHPSAVGTVYLHNIVFEDDIPYDPDNENDDEPRYDYFDWSEFEEDIKNVVNERYPSFESCDRWAGREDHVILENACAEISVSSYCGLFAICIAPKDGSDWDYDAETVRNANWTGRIAHHFEAHLEKRFAGSALRYQGSASNGEAFFRPVERPEGAVTSKEGTLW